MKILFNGEPATVTEVIDGERARLYQITPGWIQVTLNNTTAVSLREADWPLTGTIKTSGNTLAPYRESE